MYGSLPWFFFNICHSLRLKHEVYEKLVWVICNTLNSFFPPRNEIFFFFSRWNDSSINGKNIIILEYLKCLPQNDPTLKRVSVPLQMVVNHSQAICRKHSWLYNECVFRHLLWSRYPPETFRIQVGHLLKSFTGYIKDVAPCRPRWSYSLEIELKLKLKYPIMKVTLKVIFI